MTKKAEQYTYQQALGVIETFLKETKIRDFCTNYCVGSCCLECYKSWYACHKHEGRRISCSMYACDQLKQLIFTRREFMIFRRISNTITEKVETLKLGASAYYRPDTAIIKEFRINKSTLDRLSIISISDVYRKIRLMQSVMQNSKKFKYNKYPYIEV